MPKDELVRKGIILTEQGVLQGTEGKKRVHHPWKKGQVTQEVFRDIISSLEKKARKTNLN